ncbi:MAG: class I SAM-dependent methyltransferase, partial [Caldilineaceae bacterium]
WYDSKHWDVRSRVAIALDYAYDLGLHRLSGKRILDLGTGCGYFPYVCNYFGHYACGIDVYVPMYKEVVDALAIRWQECEIKAFEPLPAPDEPYDLVTAMLIFFDRHNTPEAWGCPEWRFFMEDVASRQLSENGRLFVVPVVSPETGRAFTPELETMFRDFGASIQKNRIDFHSLDAIRNT